MASTRPSKMPAAIDGRRQKKQNQQLSAFFPAVVHELRRRLVLARIHVQNAKSAIAHVRLVCRVNSILRGRPRFTHCLVVVIH